MVDSPEDSLVGKRVQIQGLSKRADLNGTVATVAKWDEHRGRFTVIMVTPPAGQNDRVAVQPKNISPLAEPAEAEADSSESTSSADEDFDAPPIAPPRWTGERRVVQDSDSEEERAHLAGLSAQSVRNARSASAEPAGGLLPRGWATSTPNTQDFDACERFKTRTIVAMDDIPDDSDEDGRPENFCLMPRDEKRAVLAGIRGDDPPRASDWRGGAPIKIACSRASRMRLPPPAGGPPPLTAKMQDALEACTQPWHRHLQKLLWHLGADPQQFTLQPHQFASVLLCAGVAAPWPACDLTCLAEDVLRNELPPTPSASGLRRGCLLGDQMGLGKTVSAVGGILVREYIALLRGDDVPAPRSTLVVVPNDVVGLQWRDHLRSAGLRSGEILRFSGDCNAEGRRRPVLRGQAYPRVVIASKYTLGKEIQGAFEHRISTPLAPLTERQTFDSLEEMYTEDKLGKPVTSDVTRAREARHKAARAVKAAKAKAAGHTLTPVPKDPGAPARLVAHAMRLYAEKDLRWETVRRPPCPRPTRRPPSLLRIRGSESSWSSMRCTSSATPSPTGGSVGCSPAHKPSAW